MFTIIDDLRIDSFHPLVSPASLINEIPHTHASYQTVRKAQQDSEKIIKGQDDRLLVIVGPCSIHDTEAALEYGTRLKDLIVKHQNELCIIMRVYFEKPRTVSGWKGLINDPDLNGTFNINKGLHLARKLLRDLAELNVPAATEFLDSIVPQFISDLIGWGAIGARTTESQIHRELASGLSMPIGFKNGTNGNIQIAIDALRASACAHHFLGVTKEGLAAIVHTKGNCAGHVILRGSQVGPNYDSKNVNNVLDELKKYNVNQTVMIDCSHGNSLKDYTRQSIVVQDICTQMISGQNKIMGVMLESNLIAGKQNLNLSKPLVYGQSLTDACIGWNETKEILEQLVTAVKERRQLNKENKFLGRAAA